MLDFARRAGKNAAMTRELLITAKAAILRRNPRREPYLGPGVPAEVIRKALKRAGIQGNIDDVVTIFSHFNGASFPKENEAWRLGFAPPIVKTIQIPPETLQMFEAMGKK